MVYGESNGHVTDDVMLPRKVKRMLVMQCPTTCMAAICTLLSGLRVVLMCDLQRCVSS